MHRHLRRRRSARLAALAALAASTAAALAAAALAGACASSETSIGADPDAGAGAEGGTDSGSSGKEAGVDAGADAAARSTCEITRAYVVACGGDLTCGPAKFDAWCKSNDDAINSAAYRRAEAECLTKDNCDGKKRRDCEYKSYGSATPTAAQTQVVTAYCQTCEPSDQAGCATRKTTYDSTKGIDSVDDVFVAAWELADPVVDEIRTKCTGSALDAGADAADGGCLKAFANCAGGVYVDRLPDCP